MTIIWLLVGLGLIVLGADIGLYDVSENHFEPLTEMRELHGSRAQTLITKL